MKCKKHFGEKLINESSIELFCLAQELNGAWSWWVVCTFDGGKPENNLAEKEEEAETVNMQPWAL